MCMRLWWVAPQHDNRMLMAMSQMHSEKLVEIKLMWVALRGVFSRSCTMQTSLHACMSMLYYRASRACSTFHQC